MTLQTTSEIFCCDPTNKQRLVDIVADPINDSSLLNLSTRISDSDGDWLIVMTVVKLAVSGLSLKAHDSKNLLLCLANLKQRTSFYSALMLSIIPMIKRILYLRSHSLSWADASSSFYRRHIMFNTNWTSVMDHLHMFARNDHK